MQKASKKSKKAVAFDSYLIAQKAEKCVTKAIETLVRLEYVPQTLLGETKDAFRRLSSELKSKDDDKIVIALAGKFSSGKSSFINSLVGEEVAPVQAERTTRCKTVFTGNPKDEKKIKIVNGSGHPCTLKQYRERSAKAAKSIAQYTVYVPDPDWRTFAVVDTPGFDPVETADSTISDDAISRLAVKESDVVFFILEMNNGTIAKDSMKYLQEITKLGRQRIFIIVNKADSKPPSAREVIMTSIAGECDRNGIRYDGILPYSSLLPTSTAILSKPDAVRPNVLKSIDEIREKLFSVIDGLSDQYQTILKKKRAAKNAVVAAEIADIVSKTRKLVMKAKKALPSHQSNTEGELRGVVTDVTDLLVDQAAACTAENASYMMDREELEGTGIFFEDWKVSLGAPGKAYKLSEKDRASLRSAIFSCFESLPWGASKLATKCVGLLEPVSRGIISSYRGTYDFEEQVDYESECDEAEETIIERLNEQFPVDFRKECRKKLKVILEVAQENAEAEIAEEREKRASALDGFVSSLALLQKELKVGAK